MSMMVSFVLSFFPRDVLDGILGLIESVSEDFPSYSFTLWGRHFVKSTSSTVYSWFFYKQGINFADIMKICM